MHTGIFTEFERGNPLTVLKKSKAFDQKRFERDLHPPEEEEEPIENHSQPSLEDKEMKDEDGEDDMPKMGQKHRVEEVKNFQDRMVIDSGHNFQQHQDELDLYDREFGFSKVVQTLIEAKKPLIGHNMIYDIGFLYQQFIDDFPKDFIAFSKAWKALFPTVFDTKVLSASTNFFGKTELSHLYYKCKNDKKLSNNISVELDKQRDQHFGLYEKAGGQGHDAGYDSYMTGFVFLSIAKFIEIGKIIKPKDNIEALSQKGKSPKKGKMLFKTTREFDSVDQCGKKTESDDSGSEKEKRKIRHYSMVQNKKIYYADLKEYSNRVMLSIDIPKHFSFDNVMTEVEMEYDRKLKASVVYVELKEPVTVLRIAELFSLYGDVNVVKTSDLSAYVELTSIDKDVVKKAGIQELINLASAENTRSFQGVIKEILPYEQARRFSSA